MAEGKKALLRSDKRANPATRVSLEGFGASEQLVVLILRTRGSVSIQRPRIHRWSVPYHRGAVPVEGCEVFKLNEIDRIFSSDRPVVAFAPKKHGYLAVVLHLHSELESNTSPGVSGAWHLSAAKWILGGIGDILPRFSRLQTGQEPMECILSDAWARIT